MSQLKQLLIFPTFLLLLSLIVYYWSKTIPLLKPDDYDSWGKFLAFLQNPQIFQTVGSSFMIKYIPFALAGLWFGFLLQSLANNIQKAKGGEPIFPLWTNWQYMIFTTVACIVWMLFVAFVQYYNLYSDPTGGGIRPGLAGYFAHIASGFGITIILYNVNLFDIYGLRGMKGRVVEVLLILVVVLVIAFNFEFTEALRPEKYYSELVDMRADMSCNTVGWGFAAALYQMFVPFEE